MTNSQSQPPASESESAPWSPGLPDRLQACRPREKLFTHGVQALSHGDLLSLVLGTGVPGLPAEKLATGLIRRHGLEGLRRLSPRDWKLETGLGRAKAARLCAVFELARRTYGERCEVRPAVHGPAQVYRRVRGLARARKEHLVGVYLDSQNGLIAQETISIGSLNTTRTHPREILYPAVQHLALGFVLAHNHPSGCLDPSPEDIEFTHAVRRAGELMGIELYDHLIVAGSGYTSLRERGLF